MTLGGLAPSIEPALVDGGLVFASTVINYNRPANISVLGPFLRWDYGWSNQDCASVVIASDWLDRTDHGRRFLDRGGTRFGLSVRSAGYSSPHADLARFGPARFAIFACYLARENRPNCRARPSSGGVVSEGGGSWAVALFDADRQLEQR